MNFIKNVVKLAFVIIDVKCGKHLKTDGLLPNDLSFKALLGSYCPFCFSTEASPQRQTTCEQEAPS